MQGRRTRGQVSGLGEQTEERAMASEGALSLGMTGDWRLGGGAACDGTRGVHGLAARALGKGLAEGDAEGTKATRAGRGPTVQIAQREGGARGMKARCR